MTTNTKRAEVLAAALNLRSGPGMDFPVVTTAKRGTLLPVVEVLPDWVKVHHAELDRDLFAAAHLVKVEDGTDLDGYLMERPELMTAELAPDRMIPTESLTGKDRIVARAWNNYGGLLGKLSDLLKIPVSAVVGIIVAESGGATFAADGRIVIRFEVHLFHRFWGKDNPTVFDRFFSFDRSSPANGFKKHAWRPNADSPFIEFHGKQEREWEVFTFARALNNDAALRSISMGAGQVLGDNFRRVGYETPQQMFDQFSRSAQAQLLAIFDYVKGPRGISATIQAMQRGDFLQVATAYNGTANAARYAEIIGENSAVFERVIPTAVAALAPAVTTMRGPDAAEVAPPPAPEVAPPAVETPKPAPAETAKPTPEPDKPVVLIATTEGLRVRSEPKIAPNNIRETLKRGEAVTLLEPLEGALAKINAGEAGGGWVFVRTDENNEGYVAAWLVERSTLITGADVDAYIDSIPDDKYPVPSSYDTFWQFQTALGLPDPFPSLPVKIRNQSEFVNLVINGFGPNTFSSRNWANYYRGTAGMHNGFDFNVKTGTPLLAVSDGIILKDNDWVFMGSPFEKTVILWCFLPKHMQPNPDKPTLLSNVLVTYAHTSDNKLRKKYDIVKAGDEIATSGFPIGRNKDTGKAVPEPDNAHLHMEVHLLSGFTTLLNPKRLAPRRLLRDFDRNQPSSNQVPWNPIYFFNRRIVKYILHQGKTVGYYGQDSYPSPERLRALGAGHLPPLDFFTLGYFEYGGGVVWENKGRAWPLGVITSDMLGTNLPTFTPFAPFEGKFLPK